MTKLSSFALALTIAAAAAPDLRAGEADVVDTKVTRTGPGVYRFEVTVRHADSGWEHYADAWEVLAPGGQPLGRRQLWHPHETEQPFTRSLSGVRIAPGTATVTIRAHDNVHGFGGKQLVIELTP